ncbi:hypothetical protein [Streptomyces qinglanensis]|uniref:hypothetical protein n=1 Tax=Streptomyces qinglanensis TaxID=943816 RepID=UPI003D731BBC
MISMKNGSRRGAKSPNPTPSGTHSIRYVSSERSSLTLSTAHRSRKPSRRPWCDLKDDAHLKCQGSEQVVLADREGAERRVCPAHAASLWLTDPSLRFSAKTPPEDIAAVMRQAFGGGR